MHRRRLARLVAALALIPAAGGCATFGTFQTASTLGRGHSQVALQGGAWGSVSSAGAPLSADLTLGVHFGITDTLDLGGRVGSNGLEVDGKLQLTPPGAPGMVVSLAPAVGGGALSAKGTSVTSVYAQVPVLLGFRFGHGHELVIGPKLEYWYASGHDAAQGIDFAGSLLGVGTSVGVSLELTGGLHLLPEISAIYPVVRWPGAAGSGGGALGGAGALAVQAGVALQFGG